LVVKTGEDSFAIDCSFCFGFSASAGTYGGVADAGADIFRSQGIGPMSKWVDDHLFIRILREHLKAYNDLRKSRAAIIARNGGMLVDGGRKWYRGSDMPDGRVEEFDEDLSFPILDLSATSPRSFEDARFTFCFDDINRLSKTLGIPWELAKDIPFSSCPPFVGFLWDIASRSISIPPKKKEKYLAAIQEWETRPSHTLQQVQELYGKLLHVSLVIPAGRAYLVSLETMLSVFHNRPHMPRRPPKNTGEDLRWWKANLAQPIVARPIPGPIEVTDPSAYSDASSGTGVAIWINGRWRAWRLLPGWKDEDRDIGWAEAIGMEFLAITLFGQCPEGSCVKVFGDNRGVVEGWWKGRSRNKATNTIFKRIHELTAVSKCSLITRYVPSAHNPADDPSRGVYPPSSLLLPPIRIPQPLQAFIADFDDPRIPAETRKPRANAKTHPLVSNHRRFEYSNLNDELRRQGEEIFKATQA
jgi:hypothetical protein